MKFIDFWKSGFKKSVAPKVFAMIRNADESGHSGVGHVLDGVIFPSGKVVVCWDPDNSKVKVEDKNVNSIAVFDSWEAFNAIHIGQHPTNGTEIIFSN